MTTKRKPAPPPETATYRVHYMKPGWFSHGIRGGLPVFADLEQTHVFLREVEAADLDDVFYQSQGEVWSPNGEARRLLQDKGLQHTSMSVGDVIERDGCFWVVAPLGFRALT